MTNTVYEEPSVLEKATRMRDRLTDQAVRSAVTRGILSVLRDEKARAEAISKLVEDTNPFVRKIGQLWSKGMDPQAAYESAMNESKPGPQPGHGGGGFALDSEPLIRSLVDVIGSALEANSALELEVTTARTQLLQFAIRQQSDLNTFLAALAMHSCGFQLAGGIPANSTPLPVKLDAMKQIGPPSQDVGSVPQQSAAIPEGWIQPGQLEQEAEAAVAELPPPEPPMPLQAEVPEDVQPAGKSTGEAPTVAQEGSV